MRSITRSTLLCAVTAASIAIAPAWRVAAQDQVESAPGPAPPSATKPVRPHVAPHRAAPAPEPEPIRPRAPVVAYPRVPPPPALPPAPRFDQSALMGRWCAGDIWFTLTPSEWRYQLPGGQTAVFQVTGIQDVSGMATITFQGQGAAATINEFRQLDYNNIIQIRGRNTSEASWHYYNRSFRRC